MPRCFFPSWARTVCILGTVLALMLMPAQTTHATPARNVLANTQAVTDPCPGLLAFPVGTSKNVSIQSASTYKYLTHISRTYGGKRNSIEAASVSVAPSSTFKVTREANGRYSFQTTDLAPNMYLSLTHYAAAGWSPAIDWLEANTSTIDANSQFAAMCVSSNGTYAFQADNYNYFTSPFFTLGEGISFNHDSEPTYTRNQFIVVGVCPLTTVGACHS